MAVAMRKEEVMLTATAAEKEELTATATIDVATTLMTPVGFKTSTSAAPLMPLNARPVTSPLTSASVTHSLSCHHDALMSWQTLVDHIWSSSTMSSLLSMQPLPELRVKKPLHFREPKKVWRSKAKKGQLWRYALPDEECMEDKQHAEVEELMLLEHHTPITRSLVRDFLMNSGRMCSPDTSPSKFGTMAKK